MTLTRSLYNIKPHHAGGVMTIGNFDGVHIAHQHLIRRVVEKARECHVPAILMTFEPYPYEFFTGKTLAMPRLTRLREKLYQLEKLEIDHMVIMNFNQRLADTSATDFLERLRSTLAPQTIMVGEDFRFGYQRQGDFELLKQMGLKMGFHSEAVPTISDDGERISSTRIRQALLCGDLATVRRLLGHPYCLHGRINRGDQLGHQLGYPTANIPLSKHLFAKGIYTVYVHGLHEQPLPGVASVGTRPTVDGTKMLLEVHLLNFRGDIYGEYIKVEFCEKLREEVRFSGIDQLKEQIAVDVLVAKEYFLNRRVSDERL